MGRKIPRLNVEIDKSLNEKLRRYIVLRWGVTESFYGKVSEVVREALNEYLDKNLEILEEEKGESTRENI